jgi:ribosomal protein S18 acetylase RimI-like enzyme
LSFLSLGVHPAFRLCGIASALVEQLERIAVESGCRSVSLHTVRETGNVAIFERLGFRVESEAPTLLFESESHRTLSEVAMRKDLNP